LHLKMLLVLNGKLHIPTLIAFPLALAGGVIAWSAWNWTTQRLAAWWTAQRRRPLRFWRVGEQGA
jgi:hypothetical protein